MASEAYTIKEMVSEIRGDLKTLNDRLVRLEELSESTLAQTTKTNGRVNKLEEDVKAIDRWKAYITGAVALAMAIGLPNLIALAQL